MNNITNEPDHECDLIVRDNEIDHEYDLTVRMTPNESTMCVVEQKGIEIGKCFNSNNNLSYYDNKHNDGRPSIRASSIDMLVYHLERMYLQPHHRYAQVHIFNN